MFSSYSSTLFYLLHLICSSLYLVESYNVTIYSSTKINYSRIVESVNNTLELRCELENYDSDYTPVLDWLLPAENENRPDTVLIDYHNNSIKLTLKKLNERDSGQYVCQANVGPSQEPIKDIVYVHVKSKSCVGNMFECSKSPKFCIPHRYVCDGFKDCSNAADESSLLCGLDPCKEKFRCPDNRCIPTFWCCKPWEPNCTAKVTHSCCPVYRDEYLLPENVITNQHFTEMTFLQSAIYTIVGFAMVFMSIVTILMIAICRIHVQRSLTSSVPPRRQQSSAILSSNLHGSFNQSGRSFNGNIVGNSRMLVSYSIPRNGLEIMGEPRQPPPYSEVTSYSDPPPSYIDIFNTPPADEENETSPCLSGEKSLP